MNDGLPRLLPGDPENLLSVEARKRLQRVLIEAEKFIWETEIAIDKKGLDRYGSKAYSLRNEAHFKKAKAAISAYRKEFSQLDIPEQKYREYMNDEIEPASNSLELSDFQRRLLETEFFFPEEKVRKPKPSSVPVVLPKKDTVGAQIRRLRENATSPPRN